MSAPTLIDGTYELRRDVGRGGAGVVFEARHLFTNRSVAIKLVAPDVAFTHREEIGLRLKREAHALASIRHPGVVEILDGGIAADGAPYIVTEMLEGRTLEGLITARGKLSAFDTACLALELCSALQAAHRAGVVHRDVKPSNIIVTRDGLGFEHMKLIDFGTATLDSAAAHKLTEVGTVLGTPQYMSPEQLMAKEDVDHLSDVYAVGIVMFECIMGTLPYAGNYAEVLLASVSPAATPSLVVDDPASAGLVAVVARATAKDRAQRFQSMTELSDATKAAMPTATPFLALLGPTTEVVSTKQRRQKARAPYLTPLVLKSRAGASLDCRVEDISEGGLLAITRGDFNHAQWVSQPAIMARFAEPMDGNVVSSEVVVRWARASRPNDPHGAHALGLEFIALDARSQASIAQYVKMMADPNQ